MEAVDCPAQAIEKLLKNYTLGRNVSAILVDMHAEATSEKLAMGYFLDGRVSAVAGTHTHVPTADARILPKGTAYITDVGMCGNYESVLGFEVEEPVNRLNPPLYGRQTGTVQRPGHAVRALPLKPTTLRVWQKQSNKSGFRAGNVIADAVKTFFPGKLPNGRQSGFADFLKLIGIVYQFDNLCRGKRRKRRTKNRVFSVFEEIGHAGLIVCDQTKAGSHVFKMLVGISRRTDESDADIRRHDRFRPSGSYR